ncbi:MAG TPA: hypothetical protein VL334_06130 [Anaerolineae bacterium]|nr:hypothetical protein [Anaerolineae bacterium]
MTMPSDDLQRIQQVCSTVYRPDPTNRSYPWHPRNPVSQVALPAAPAQGA